ncbi:MAG: Sua5/YciO/YrdC/YwlC family protein, partial [Parcubacteria group bacterium]|nr:Sua5/YciO/YrdC/YwlC family protein [Parcubacteria group bacterium]
TLAFRLPADKNLRKLLEKTGPLVAPSANLEGLPPAKNIIEAKRYFEDLPDLYIDGQEISGKPSKLIKLQKDCSEIIIRD